MNLKSIFVLIASFIWLFVSVKQWAFDYPDLSNLIFALGFYFGGLFVAYFVWLNDILLKEGSEMFNDIQAIDKKCNDLEVRLIDLKNERRKN